MPSTNEMEGEMSAKVGYVAIDSVDPNSLAPFWCELLGVEVDTTIGEGEFRSSHRPRMASPSAFNGCRRQRQERTVSIWILWSMTWTPPRQRLSDSAVVGENRERPESLRASAGAAWQILRATSSTSMFSPMIRPDRF